MCLILNEISLDEDSFGDSPSLNFDTGDVDEVYKAVDIVVNQQKVSTSLFRDTFKLVIIEQQELWKRWRIMVLFQKQTTQAKDKYKKQINLNFLGCFW